MMINFTKRLMWIASAGWFLFCGGCQKLEEDPRGSLVSESFFKTENDLQAAVTACYYPLTNHPFMSFGSTRVWTALMGGDDLTTHPGSNKENFRDFDRFAGSALNSDLQYCAWSVPYKIVFAANTVMENYKQVQGRDEFIMRAVAQARFLRAFAYFWMVRTFGSIPLVTSTQADYHIYKSSVADIYAFIISDLLFAESVLPATWPPADQGRPTVWAAKGLLSQVYLTMAGWPLKDAAKYTLAAAKAKEVIDQSAHTLVTRYADVFALANQNNKEIVWAIRFCGLADCSWPYMNTHGGNATNPSEEGGWDDVFCELGFYKRFPAGPRKDATFHTVFSNGMPFSQSVTKHPYIAKYRDGTDPDSANFIHAFFTHRNLNYLRFAELLLIYAEASAIATGTPDATAYEAINKVRRRAGTPELVSGLSPTVFRDSVVAERGWELAAEFSRWFDLVRTEQVEAMAALKDPLDLQPLTTVSHAQYLAPIPDREILLNPNLK